MSEREFTGIFIKRVIWESKDLCPLEKILLAEIECLSQSKPCYASNKHLYEFLQVSERRLQQMLSNLVKLGLLETDKDENGGRVMWVKYITPPHLKYISGKTKDISPFTIPIIDKSKKKDNTYNLKYFSLGKLLHDKIKEQSPDAIIKESQINNWCNDIRLMIESDKRTEEQVKNKIIEVFEDKFWKKVVRSAGSLRKSWNAGKLPGGNGEAANKPEADEVEDIIELREYDL